MVGTGHAGVVTISIDLELEIDHYTSRRQGELDRVRDRLCELLQAYRIPATWAVADPARSAASDPILASGMGHEIAVLGDRTWIGPGAGRTRLSRELARRFDGARRVGIAATTLVLRGCDCLPEVDLLLAHAVTAVRAGTEAASPRSHPPVAAPLRYGIWQAPPARLVPSLKSWWNPSRWIGRRELRSAIATGALLHFQIDAPQLIESCDLGLRGVEELAAALSQHPDQQRLRLATLGTLAAEHLRQRSATSARSILRPAA